MASNGNFDLGSLTASQREALQQYTDVTSQDIKDAIPLLERSQWNVQIAIAKFFDGEGPDPLAEAQAAHQNLPLPSPPFLYRTPFLVTVLFAPFRLGYTVFAAVFNSLLYFLSFLPLSLRPRFVATSITKGLRQTNGRRVTLPTETAQRFRRDFEEEYGPQALPFFEGGHAQALDTAKRDVKFLLTVLLSPEHDDTESFVRNTLLSPEVLNFINDPANNIILWGGNVLDSEAYQVAREYNCVKFPFSCLVCLTPKEGSTRMGIVKRLVGPMTPEAYLAGIQSAIAKYGPDLNGVRAERAAQEMARKLRSQQDSAYERSLAADRERARQKREAAAAAAAAEKRAREEAEAAARLQQLRQKWREWRASTVAPEPDAATKGVVRLALNMPASSGAGRVVRRFTSQTTTEELYAFVECYDLLGQQRGEKAPEKPEGYEHKYAFRIASVMPREILEPSAATTLGEKLGRGGNLVVEDIDPDDEDDE
ncbi:8c8727d7-bddb-4dc5-9649-93615069d26a [Thermothielavioides terrestris]|uniref:8c8727d7-bddb-4dc5-9649-93615069d26a n=1 Tax=Thermothielavioides terrestris TaxID=2587410 RepID=A0A3S4EYW8_9PEZI|nr:8c8727d7-bddb-4dc5-9649-93615069d26a [Thermothielavioides terrestris]